MTGSLRCHLLMGAEGQAGSPNKNCSGALSDVRFGSCVMIILGYIFKGVANAFLRRADPACSVRSMTGTGSGE